MASPCAACKFLRRKCTSNCVFAPYFPPDQPGKFANVHKIFGASNVAKLLNDLPQMHREEAVNSLAYEADARITDPVYGCVAHISYLHVKIKEVQDQLILAKKELSNYTTMCPSVFSSLHPQTHLITQNSLSAGTPASYMAAPFGLSNVSIGMDLGLGSSATMPSHSVVPYRDPVEAQQQQQQQALAMESLRVQNQSRFNAAVEGLQGGYDGQFNSNLASSVQDVELVSPQMAQIQHQHQTAQPLAFDGRLFFVRSPLQQQVEQLQNLPQTQPQGIQTQMQYFMEHVKQQPPQQRRVGNDEGRSFIRPSLP